MNTAQKRIKSTTTTKSKHNHSHTTKCDPIVQCTYICIRLNTKLNDNNSVYNNIQQNTAQRCHNNNTVDELCVKMAYLMTYQLPRTFLQQHSCRVIVAVHGLYHTRYSVFI